MDAMDFYEREMEWTNQTPYETSRALALAPSYFMVVTGEFLNAIHSVEYGGDVLGAACGVVFALVFWWLVMAFVFRNGLYLRLVGIIDGIVAPVVAIVALFGPFGWVGAILIWFFAKVVLRLSEGLAFLACVIVGDFCE